MSRKIAKIKEQEKALTLQALEEAARRMSGTYPAVTLINELLTESEKITLGRRILIAQMILAGKTIGEIRETLRVSPNTYTQTRKWLDSQIPNYDDLLKKIKQEEEAKKVQRHEKSLKVKKYAPANTFQGVKERYPMHFLLFSLAEELLTIRPRK